MCVVWCQSPCNCLKDLLVFGAFLIFLAHYRVGLGRRVSSPPSEWMGVPAKSRIGSWSAKGLGQANHDAAAKQQRESRCLCPAVVGGRLIRLERQNTLLNRSLYKRLLRAYNQHESEVLWTCHQAVVHGAQSGDCRLWSYHETWNRTPASLCTRTKRRLPKR